VFDNMKRADEEGAMNPIYIMADSGGADRKTADSSAFGNARMMAKPSVK